MTGWLPLDKFLNSAVRDRRRFLLVGLILSHISTVSILTCEINSTAYCITESCGIVLMLIHSSIRCGHIPLVSFLSNIRLQ